MEMRISKTKDSVAKEKRRKQGTVCIVSTILITVLGVGALYSYQIESKKITPVRISNLMLQNVDSTHISGIESWSFQ